MSEAYGNGGIGSEKVTKHWGQERGACTSFSIKPTSLKTG